MKLKEKKSDRVILATALKKASLLAGLSQLQLSSFLHVSTSALSRDLKNGIDPDSLKGHVACFVVKILRSLIGVSGNNKDFMYEWLNAYVKPLDGKPIELMTTLNGLIAVNNYLEYMERDYGYL